MKFKLTLSIKTVKMMFWSVTQELLSLLNAIWVTWVDNLLQDAYIIFQKGVDNFEIKHDNFD